MQDFGTITHRYIAAPEPISSGAANQRMFLAMLAVGVLAIVIAGLIAASVLFGDRAATGTALPPPPDTATATPPPTATFTATPHPLVGQPAYELVTGLDALAEPGGADTLGIPPAEDGPLQYLRIGFVDGFTVTMQVADNTEVTRYGLAFRVQDSANYLLFTLSPTSGTWIFSEVEEGARTVLSRGILEAVPETLTIAGLDDYFRVEAGEETLISISSLFPTGSLALYIEGGTLALESLSVGLVGPEAEAAQAQAPTPAPGIADPRRFLRSDVEALLDTRDPVNITIDCPAFIRLHDSLERHTNSRNAEVRRQARRIEDAGEIIYSRCRSESPSEPLNFLLTGFTDYDDWQNALTTIQEELAE